MRDDKGSLKVDANSERLGLLSAYYFFDDYTLNNPYPTGQGGASVPGFNALILGRAQLIDLGDTKTFGPSTVNELRLSFMRESNNVGQPAVGWGRAWLPKARDRRRHAGYRSPGAGHRRRGERHLQFFRHGNAITNQKQANNTYAAVQRVQSVGSAYVKAGLDLSFEQASESQSGI